MGNAILDFSGLGNLSANDVRALAWVANELDRARGKFGKFASAHEGYAVLLEEVEELWEVVRSKARTRGRLTEEAVQVGAMAVRFLVDVARVANPTSDDFMDAMGDADRSIEAKFYGDAEMRPEKKAAEEDDKRLARVGRCFEWGLAGAKIPLEYGRDPSRIEREAWVAGRTARLGQSAAGTGAPRGGGL